MAKTNSTMLLPLGTPAPYFELPDTVSGKTVSLNELKSDTATVIAFICNHCPFVKHIIHDLVRVAKQYQAKGVAFIAINSNDVVNFPDDSPERMRVTAKELNFSFPYLYDESQEVAKAYTAACTPDFYIFDGKLACVYRGQFDDSRPGSDRPITGKDLSQALDAILAGTPVNAEQKPSLGCNIKWKS